jgi:hypothetical protein
MTAISAGDVRQLDAKAAPERAARRAAAPRELREARRPPPRSVSGAACRFVGPSRYIPCLALQSSGFMPICFDNLMAF